MQLEPKNMNPNLEEILVHALRLPEISRNVKLCILQ